MESQDWAQSCIECTQNGRKEGFKLEVIDFQPGEEAGLKISFKTNEIMLLVWKAEAGVHLMKQFYQTQQESIPPLRGIVYPMT